MKKTFGFAALAAVALTALGLWATGPGSPGRALLPNLAAQAQDTAAATPTDPATIVVPDMTMGNPDATVTLTEYASYTCPHCARFHADVFKPLKADYIDTGKVKFVYREVYFDGFGLWAAMIARCGGEMRYFGINAILLETQADWAGSQDQATVVESLKTIGRTAGMDDATLDACLADTAMAEAMVTAFQTNVQTDGVEGTPTLFVNGTKYSNMSYADLKVILDAELAK
ncbi:MAG: DsbA family protein [Rhodobacterales bacterium]|nr:DsbA family protein [Rhodobacterales bacterium]